MRGLERESRDKCVWERHAEPERGGERVREKGIERGKEGERESEWVGGGKVKR